MIKIAKILFASLLFVLSTKVYAHCQVPCGIYGDAVRVVQIEEDITTVRKAMNMINDLAGQSDAQSLNQLSRWVRTKEDHAQKVQETVLNYFLAQRVKAKEKGSKERQQYVDQTLTLHQLIVSMMKCKQTVEQRNCSNAFELLDKFTNLYFEQHGIDHLKKLKKEK
jgi:nickel superoxide dismutase|tara:strand:- start:85 stop:582 length:498 start_codon:yes stop_codon:yes gene_type:complete